MCQLCMHVCVKMCMCTTALRSTGTAHHFAYLLNTSDYRILRMDEDHDRMYVGSKDHILSLDLHDINKDPHIIHWPVSERRRMECLVSGKDANEECANFIRLVEPWNRTQLYVCGTGAYNPVCTFVNRGRKPQVRIKVLRNAQAWTVISTYINSANINNGELYAGVYVDFMGTDSAIFRTLGTKTAMRTDQYNSRWLNDPTFIHVQLIPDSAERNDDKLYFFFREKSSEMGHSPVTQSRIGRICLNDDGGHCCLVNKWSTFLKARLICSVPGADGMETHFDELREYTDLNDTKNPVIYGVFSVSGSVFKGSAVCVYSMADIRMVFNGPFAHKEGPNYQWVAYTGKIPYPRPGTCPGGTFTPNMKSTKDYPDEVINFMRNHPAMYNAVYPIHKRPLVVRTNVDYEFTTITVDQVTAADGNYEVLFLGTDKGTVQKVIVLPRDDLQTEELVLEEVEVFKVTLCITPCSVLSLSQQQQLYVSSVLGLTQLALHRCDVYGEACADCCLARDPYCAWDGKSCSRYSASQKRRSRRQDVKYGNPIRQCRGFNSNANKNTLEMVQYGVEGSSTFLECQARSPHAVIKWHLQRDNSDRRKEMRSDGRILKTEQGLLLRSLQPSDSGMYQCTATEKNFKHMLVKLQLVVLSSRAVNNVLVEGGGGLVPSSLHSSSTQWTPSSGQYKDLLTILSQPEMSLINQYCQDYWQFGDPLLGALKAKDLKELKEQKKPRNRRHHGEGEGEGEEKYEQEEQEEAET
uniref:Semaphorin 3F n=1 Tax=Sander lucioperca TaxID=283035 RepID=A0A8D0CU17_SANLU